MKGGTGCRCGVPSGVVAVEDGGRHLRVRTDRGAWIAAAVVSATGTWSKPFVPE